MSGVGITYLWLNKEFPPFVRLEGRRGDYEVYAPERACEYVIEDNMNETEGMGDVWFRCTNCDMCFDYADDWLLKMPYCPHCGARVKARNT